MIDLRMMAAGLTALGHAFNREVTPQVADVYHGVIGPKLNAAQWERAVRRALDAETFFPPPAVLPRRWVAAGSRRRGVRPNPRRVRGGAPDGST